MARYIHFPASIIGFHTVVINPVIKTLNLLILAPINIQADCLKLVTEMPIPDTNPKGVGKSVGIGIRPLKTIEPHNSHIARSDYVRWPAVISVN